MSGEEIRADFRTALTEAKHGYDLSGDLEYCFSDEDITELAKLHRDEPELREKIEDLLEDCNFHTESMDFSDGNYDPYL